MVRIFAIAVFSFVFLFGCKEDPEEAANKLFVEAAPLWTLYQTLPEDEPTEYATRLDLLTQVRAKLNIIVSNYPESSLAVELVSTGSIKNLKKEDIESSIDMIEGKISCAKDFLKCVVSRALAESAGLTSDWDRATLVTKIALAQLAGGNTDGAKASMEIVLKARDNTPDEDLLRILLPDIAVAQAKLGDLDGSKVTISAALEIVSKASNSSSKFTALAKIAQAQALLGDIDSALQTAEMISTYSDQIEAIAGISTSLSRDNKLELAQSTILIAIKSSDGFVLSDAALGEIARAQMALGQVSDAFETINRMELNDSRAYLQVEIAVAQAKLGDFKGAQSTISLAKETFEKARGSDANESFLADLAIAQASARDFSEAFKTATSIEAEWAPAILAIVQTQSENISGALTTAESIPDVYLRTAVLAEISLVIADKIE